MYKGFRLARVFGIEITVDWSWLFIFLLVTWNLAAGVFPQLHPNWGIGLNLAVSLIASLLFFASVLAHELAHSLVARARDLPVRRITLFLFGGVSNIQREPPSPGAEFVIAIVGPLTSIILGIVFLLLGGGTASLSAASGNMLGQLSGLSPLSTLLLWLGPINIILGLFNLIPGFPLDGGRVLRSILWATSGNLVRATRWASIVGQVIAWLLIIAGIAMVFGVQIPFFGTGFLAGIWLAFIGWFLNSASAQSYQQVVVRDLLEGVPVARLMRSDVPTVAPDTRLSELVDGYLMQSDERAFPVVENGALAGLVCLEDIRAVPHDRWETTLVRAVMTPTDKLAVVSPREDAADALDELSRRDVRQLPVIDAGRLVGIVRRRDFVRWLQLHADAHAMHA